MKTKTITMNITTEASSTETVEEIRQNITTLPDVEESKVNYPRLRDSPQFNLNALMKSLFDNINLKETKNNLVLKKENDNASYISQIIQEDLRMNTRVSDKKTFIEVWNTNSKFREALLNHPDKYNEGKWELSSKYGYKLPTPFQPVYAREIYKYLTLLLSPLQINEIRVLDPTAGWGDRLLGALAAGVGEYVGVDTNTKLEPGYKEMIELFGKSNTKTSFYMMDYLKFIDSSNFDKYFHIIFTSPPFFDYEVYPEMPIYKDWIKEFYTPFVYGCLKQLQEKGILALYLEDTKAGQIEEFLNNIPIIFKKNFEVTRLKDIKIQGDKKLRTIVVYQLNKAY